jgi:hypothetical protein
VICVRVYLSNDCNHLLLLLLLLVNRFSFLTADPLSIPLLERLAANNFNW